MRKFFTSINFNNAIEAQIEADILRQRLETGIKFLEKFQVGCENPNEASAANKEIMEVVRDIAAALLCKQIEFTLTSFGDNIDRSEGFFKAENLKCRKCGIELPEEAGEITCISCGAKYLIVAAKILGSSDDLNIVAEL